jgi:hypothetical protein
MQVQPSWLKARVKQSIIQYQNHKWSCREDAERQSSSSSHLPRSHQTVFAKHTAQLHSKQQKSSDLTPWWCRLMVCGFTVSNGILVVWRVDGVVVWVWNKCMSMVQYSPYFILHEVEYFTGWNNTTSYFMK